MAARATNARWSNESTNAAEAGYATYDAAATNHTASHCKPYTGAKKSIFPNAPQ